jgi:hypothetical protein
VPNCIHVIHHFSVKIRMRLVTDFPPALPGKSESLPQYSLGSNVVANVRTPAIFLF